MASLNRSRLNFLLWTSLFLLGIQLVYYALTNPVISSHTRYIYFYLQADDPELEAIRQRRMAEMMAQQSGGGGKVGFLGLLYTVSQSNSQAIANLTSVNYAGPHVC
jgi:hypothetical protein